MKITIIGWYGTETLGDRAILDGIISIFNVDSLKEIYLGSLYPFFTERTIFEDCYSERYPGLKINLVNIYDIRQMKHAVKNSSFVLMGGGPLMELDELLLIEKVFSFAKNKKIKTAIVGCGYGPVKGDFYKATIKKIFLLSDYIIFRDSKSKEIVDKNIMNLKTFVCEDPALVSILKYSEMRKKKNNGNRNNYAIVNLRSYPEQSYGKNDELIRCLSCIPALIKNENKVFFLSMHTFFIGGDDRLYMDSFVRNNNLTNSEVISKPMNLFETYETIAGANKCIGMRYHAIVMQTLLNGNNFIIDYTNKENGKISSFIKDIDKNGFFESRIINNLIDFTIFSNSKIKFSHNLSSNNIVFSYRKILGLI